MKISITGASGHIGNNLCRELINQKHRVKALVHTFDKSLKGLDRLCGTAIVLGTRT